MSDEPEEEAAESPESETAPEDDAAGEDEAASEKAPWQPHPIVGPTTAMFLALLSGALCPVAFAGFDVWPLSFVAWVPLLIAWRGQTAKRALVLGLWSGFAMMMIGFYWLITTLETFSGFDLWLCVLFAAVLCLQKAGRIGLMGWLYARATKRGYHHALSLLGAFAVSELVWPVLFPWYFAASLHQVPIMIQTADLGGPILVGVIIMAVNVAIAELASQLIFKRGVDKRVLIAGAALPLFALGYGALKMSSVQAKIDAAPSVKLGLVQGNTPLKRRSRALKTHLDLTEELRQQNVDLVIWSESGVSRTYGSDNLEANVKRRLTQKLKVPVIAGIQVRERIKNAPRRGRKRRYYNTAIMADAEGNVTGRYDKQVLLMFGEYMPLGETFPKLYEISRNSGKFSPGTSFEPLMFGERKISTMICYEDINPTFVNALVEAAGDPDLLVNITNDAWFGDTIEPYQHLALAKFRAVEHHKYLVRATNSGVTTIIDPLGRLTLESELFEKKAFVGEARYMKGKSVYALIGNIPWWIVGAFMLLMAFVERRRKGDRRF